MIEANIIQITRRVLLLSGCIALLGLAAWAQGSRFDSSSLSQKGRQAYYGLLKVELFAIGGIGYGGTTSSGEKFLDVLIEEKTATEAFKQLITDGTTEGGFYGLFGLKMLNCDCFEKELARYKYLRLSTENKSPFRTQSGCLVFKAVTQEDKQMILQVYMKDEFLKMAHQKECRRQFKGRPNEQAKCWNEELKQK